MQLHTTAVAQDAGHHDADFGCLFADEVLVAGCPGVGEFVEGEAQVCDRLRNALSWGEIGAWEGEDVAQRRDSPDAQGMDE